MENSTTLNAAPGRTLSFGEQAVGITFNPANDPNVQKAK